MRPPPNEMWNKIPQNVDERNLPKWPSDGNINVGNRETEDTVRKFSVGAPVYRPLCTEPRDLLRAKLKNTRSLVDLGQGNMWNAEGMQRHGQIWGMDMDESFIQQMNAEIIPNLLEIRATSWNDLSQRQPHYKPWFDAKPPVVSSNYRRVVMVVWCVVS